MSETIQKEETQLKPTEYGPTPNGWSTIRLGELADDSKSAFVDGPFGSDLKSSEFSDNGHARVIQLQNIRPGEFIDTNHKYITEKKFEELKRHATYPGDIAIAKMADPVARACIVPDIEDQYVVVADCIKLTIDESKADKEYVTLALNSHPVWRQAFVRSRGSTRKRINLTQLKQVEIPYPPLAEQRRIADILSTVDEQIQQTEEVIEKRNELKRGVMQNVFDINTTPETTSPELLDGVQKKSLGDLVEIISGVHVKSEHVTHDSSETPYLTGPADFENRGFSVTKYTDKTSKFCEPGDTLVTVKGSGCGNSTFATQKAGISRQLKALRPGDSLDEQYLYYYLQTKTELLSILAQGTSIPGLSTSDLTTLTIPLPALEEQQRIGDLFATIDDQITVEREHKNELQQLKRGLMQDLLTGTKRVEPEQA